MSYTAITTFVCVIGFTAGAFAGTRSPSHPPAPAPSMPCLTQTLEVEGAQGIIIVDCSIRNGATLETPAPAGNTFRHGVWIQHVGGPRDGTYSYRL